MPDYVRGKQGGHLVLPKFLSNLVVWEALRQLWDQGPLPGGDVVL